MLCKVKKAFPYAVGGIAIKSLEVGQEVDIDDDLVPGLRKAGLLQAGGDGSSDLSTAASTGAPEAAAMTATPADLGAGGDPVEIPENWQDLGWHELRALAAKITGGTIADKASAESAITAEIERRAR